MRSDVMEYMENGADIIAPQTGCIEPEAFQARLIDKISSALLRDNPPPCLLRAPTGAGKTFVLAKAIDKVSERSATVWFWFVPFVNLIQQTEESIVSNAVGLIPVPLARGRNQDPKNGLVVISTAAAVAKASSRKAGYSDGQDDEMRSLSDQVMLARARGMKVGLIVDEAHIGLDKQTEFGQFAHWLKPDRLLMATATPKDQRLNDFLVSAEYSDHESFSVSRDEVVHARLNKRYIEAVVYDLRQSIQTITDLQQTVLRQAWKRNQRIKKKLVELGIGVTPLLLVQVANGENSVSDARQHLMRLCGVPPSAIGEHSADTPDPALMASIAHDTTKEVLIFKQSAGTGFDAPRAFVLASTKPVNDPDFAMQFIGRVMRVHRSIRAAFPQTTPVDAEIDTAYVYLANAEAQAGFEQAVSATALLRSQLEGQTEKLVARKMASGAVQYTNRTTEQMALIHDAGLPNNHKDNGTPAKSTTLPTTTIGATGELFADEDGEFGLDKPAAVVVTHKEESSSGLRTISLSGTGNTACKTLKSVKTVRQLLDKLADNGIRAYALKQDLDALPSALKREERPVMADMANASRAVAARLEIPPGTLKMALLVAFDKVKDKEVHTELTNRERTTVDVAVIVERTALAKEAREALRTLPQVEDEDLDIIIRVLSNRLAELVKAEISDEDDDEGSVATTVKKRARDAAFWVIRREIDGLREQMHAEIATQAEYIDSARLPDVMLFPTEIHLEASIKNIYGVLPPSSADLGKVSTTLPIDARTLMADRTVTLEGNELSLSQFDGSHELGEEERAFAKALDRADFIRWWHRNPDRKPYSARLVRGEHKNYFYPDFIICLEHYPGDDPLLRLVETKESLKDAARKARHVSQLYGRVLFLTKDQSRMRWVNENGTMGEIVDPDDLAEMREWLRATRPTAAS